VAAGAGSGAQIQVTGLREFQRALKSMDTDLPKQIRVALNGAAELVIKYAEPRIPTKTGRGRASLKARSSQREARIAMGGKRAVYMPWLDFGGQGKRKGRPSARPFIKEGRYIYPGLAANRDEITATMTDALAELARGAGLEMS
jgi:hypothetical protein